MRELINSLESGRQPFVAAKLGYVCIETEKSHTFRPYGHASTVFISIFCDSEDGKQP